MRNQIDDKELVEKIAEYMTFDCADCEELNDDSCNGRIPCKRSYSQAKKYASEFLSPYIQGKVANLESTNEGTIKSVKDYLVLLAQEKL